MIPARLGVSTGTGKKSARIVDVHFHDAGCVSRYTDAVFTGIIERQGKVAAIAPSEAGKRLLIDPGDWAHGAARGDSIAVNGCCLTHAPSEPIDAREAGLLCFDVISETLQKTNLGDLAQGDRVNLEASITAATPMSGHFVQGHIEDLGKVMKLETADEDRRMTVQVDAGLMPAIIPKGSVAIDGVSLTVAQVDAQVGRAWGTFTVALIPTTLELTTLGAIKAGDTVNIETDMIARTVVHCLRHGLSLFESGANGGGGSGSSVTMQTLRDAGFV